MTKLPVLISYAYLRDKTDDVVRSLLARSDVEILLDCGAFTAANTGQDDIDLGDYMRWIDKWRAHLFGYIALDKVGDPVTTERNLRTMLANGFEPIPVHVLGDDERRMDELFDLTYWVALGGLRRPGRAHAPLSYVKSKMAWAKGRNVHWLGYTRAVDRDMEAVQRRLLEHHARRKVGTVRDPSRQRAVGDLLHTRQDDQARVRENCDRHRAGHRDAQEARSVGLRRRSRDAGRELEGHKERRQHPRRARA